jgi:hypothetical protein
MGVYAANSDSRVLGTLTYTPYIGYHSDALLVRHDADPLAPGAPIGPASGPFLSHGHMVTPLALLYPTPWDSLARHSSLFRVRAVRGSAWPARLEAPSWQMRRGLR